MSEQRSLGMYGARHFRQEYLPKLLEGEDFTDSVNNFSNSIFIDLHYAKPSNVVSEYDKHMFSNEDFSRLSYRLSEVKLPPTWGIILSAHPSSIHLIKNELTDSDDKPVVVLPPFQFSMKLTDVKIPDYITEIINQIDLHWNRKCCIYT